MKSMRNPSIPHRQLLAVIALGLVSVGCSPRISVPRTTEEGLREQLATTIRERDEAQRRVRDLEGKLAERPRAAAGAMTPEAEGVLPRLDGIRVDPSMSSVRLDGPSGAVLRLVLEPIDGKGRFLQITGDLEIGAMLTNSPNDMVSVGDLRCGPKALSDAYRSGFLGSHYSFELPLKIDSKQAPKTIVVNGVFNDALTGKPVSFQQVVAVRQFAAAPAQ